MKSARTALYSSSLFICAEVVRFVMYATFPPQYGTSIGAELHPVTVALTSAIIVLQLGGLALFVRALVSFRRVSRA